MSTLVPGVLRSFVMLPITIGEHWFGMVFAGRNGPSTFTEEFIRGYETLVSQVAIALESIRLFEETQRRAERERLISEVTTRIRETLDVETVLKTAAREIGEALGLVALDVRLDLAETLPSGEPKHNQEATGG